MEKRLKAEKEREEKAKLAQIAQEKAREEAEKKKLAQLQRQQVDHLVQNINFGFVWLFYVFFNFTVKLFDFVFSGEGRKAEERRTASNPKGSGTGRVGTAISRAETAGT